MLTISPVADDHRSSPEPVHTPETIRQGVPLTGHATTGAAPTDAAFFGADAATLEADAAEREAGAAAAIAHTIVSATSALALMVILSR